MEVCELWKSSLDILEGHKFPVSGLTTLRYSTIDKYAWVRFENQQHQNMIISRLTFIVFIKLSSTF